MVQLFHFPLSLFVTVLFLVVNSFNEILVSEMNKDGECIGNFNPGQLQRYKRSSPNNTVPIAIYDEVQKQTKWNKKYVTYRITEYTNQLSKEFIDREFKKAFELWEEHINLDFINTNDTAVDIEIRFCLGHHDDTMPFREFDMAHAFSPGEYEGGDIHLNDNITIWHDGTTLLHTATHEIGHAIGLYHIPLSFSIMSPYQGHAGFPVQLALEDIRAAQALYGKRPPKISLHTYPPPPPLPTFSRPTYRTEKFRTNPTFSTTTRPVTVKVQPPETTRPTTTQTPATTVTTTSKSVVSIPTTTSTIPTLPATTEQLTALPNAKSSVETYFPDEEFTAEPRYSDFEGSGDSKNEFNEEISDSSDKETTKFPIDDLFLEENRNTSESKSCSTTLIPSNYGFVAIILSAHIIMSLKFI